MLKIEPVNINHLDSLISLANANIGKLTPNNRMIYYLCCTVFNDCSFLAIQDLKPIGFIFAMPDVSMTSYWIHQIAVHPKYIGMGVGFRLITRLEKEIEKKRKDLVTIRLAVKKENLVAKQFYKKLNYQLVKFDSWVEMEIFEKILSLQIK